MNIKQIIAQVLTGALILFASPALAYAQVNVPGNVPGYKYALNENAGSPSSGLRANPTGIINKQTNLQTRAASEIQRRITSLNEAITKINGIKRLSSAQKSQLTTQIQTEVANLTALGTKIQSDTDPAMLKTDVQSVVTSFRIYALFMPQIRLLTAASSLLDVSDKLSSLSAGLTTRISEAQAAGQNVTSMQTTLSDMQTQVTNAQTQANSVITTVSPLTPSDFPGSTTKLQTARTALQTGIQDAKNAGKDAKQIIQGLIALGGAAQSNISTNSAVPLTAPLQTPQATTSTIAQP